MTSMDPAAQVPGAPLDQPCTLEIYPLGAHSQYQAVPGTFRERALDLMIVNNLWSDHKVQLPFANAICLTHYHLKG